METSLKKCNTADKQCDKRCYRSNGLFRKWGNSAERN